MLGVIGGSGFYSFFGPDARSVSLDTPYGAPERSDHRRHGRRARGGVPAAPRREPRVLAAHRALPRQHVGAARARRPPDLRAVRGRQPDARTGPRRRWWCPISSSTAPAAAPDTYFDSGGIHVGFADPYCPTLRAAAPDLPGVVDGGTMVVIQGPRFSTRAESRSGSRGQGFTLVNMTGYPEAVLARELEMCYAAIALVTDLDAGIEAGDGRDGRSTCSPSSRRTWCRSRSWCTRRSIRCAVERTCTHCLPHDGRRRCRSSCREGSAHRRRGLHRHRGCARR